MDRGCHRRLLAHGESCRVEQCSCGTLHVSVGALTLRLEPAVVADTSITLERALLALEGASGHASANGGISPPHDPEERELAQTIGDWEVRVFADAKFGFFVERGLWHVQLWHRAAGVSVLTPSRLTGGLYEVSSARGVKRRASSHAKVRELVRAEHDVTLIDADALARVERVFVHAPVAFAASPHGSS